MLCETSGRYLELRGCRSSEPVRKLLGQYLADIQIWKSANQIIVWCGTWKQNVVHYKYLCADESFWHWAIWAHWKSFYLNDLPSEQPLLSTLLCYPESISEKYNINEWYDPNPLHAGMRNNESHCSGLSSIIATYTYVTSSELASHYYYLQVWGVWVNCAPRWSCLPCCSGSHGTQTSYMADSPNMSLQVSSARWFTTLRNTPCMGWTPP